MKNRKDRFLGACILKRIETLCWIIGFLLSNILLEPTTSIGFYTMHLLFCAPTIVIALGTYIFSSFKTVCPLRISCLFELV